MEYSDVPVSIGARTLRSLGYVTYMAAKGDLTRVRGAGTLQLDLTGRYTSVITNVPRGLKTGYVEVQPGLWRNMVVRDDLFNDDDLTYLEVRYHLLHPRAELRAHVESGKGEVVLEGVAPAPNRGHARLTTSRLMNDKSVGFYADSSSKSAWTLITVARVRKKQEQ